MRGQWDYSNYGSKYSSRSTSAYFTIDIGYRALYLVEQILLHTSNFSSNPLCPFTRLEEFFHNIKDVLYLFQNRGYIPVIISTFAFLSCRQKKTYLDINVECAASLRWHYVVVERGVTQRHVGPGRGRGRWGRSCRGRGGRLGLLGTALTFLVVGTHHSRRRKNATVSLISPCFFPHK